ncbi:unnamed protein product [Cyprideis torosa]|uniref:Uncharacterized protein n=1 Tax=Cyprideis torosa TaxID=163714 RepID=A0A7R8ZPS3_9CRUS|nr:unnamed protein product [Cyprideis torosa]CAG0894670.1 unnamed protein product [Cyprideis torosa]
MFIEKEEGFPFTPVISVGKKAWFVKKNRIGICHPGFTEAVERLVFHATLEMGMQVRSSVSTQYTKRELGIIDYDPARRVCPSRDITIPRPPLFPGPKRLIGSAKLVGLAVVEPEDNCSPTEFFCHYLFMATDLKIRFSKLEGSSNEHDAPISNGPRAILIYRISHSSLGQVDSEKIIARTLELKSLLLNGASCNDPLVVSGAETKEQSATSETETASKETRRLQKLVFHLTHPYTFRDGERNVDLSKTLIGMDKAIFQRMQLLNDFLPPSYKLKFHLAFVVDVKRSTVTRRNTSEMKNRTTEIKEWIATDGGGPMFKKYIEAREDEILATSSVGGGAVFLMKLAAMEHRTRTSQVLKHLLAFWREVVRELPVGVDSVREVSGNEEGYPTKADVERVMNVIVELGDVESMRFLWKNILKTMGERGKLASNYLKLVEQPGVWSQATADVITETVRVSMWQGKSSLLKECLESLQGCPELVQKVYPYLMACFRKGKLTENTLNDIREKIVWFGSASRDFKISVADDAISELKEELKDGKPEFMWSVPRAVCPSNPDVEDFLKGPRESLTISGFTSEPRARRWVQEHIESVALLGCKEARMELVKVQFARAQSGGDFRVRITKTKEYFEFIEKRYEFIERRLARWEQKLGEILTVTEDEESMEDLMREVRRKKVKSGDQSQERKTREDGDCITREASTDTKEGCEIEEVDEPENEDARKEIAVKDLLMSTDHSKSYEASSQPDGSVQEESDPAPPLPKIRRV